MTIKRTVKYVVILAVLIAAAVFGWKYFSKPAQTPEEWVFRTETVSIADIRRTISATGTVEPEELVNVGAQVNGKIMAFGKDADGKTVDYGSKVKTGMLLAQIDDVTYKAQLQEAEASLQQAEASILSADAAIKEAHANAILAKNNWERAQTLYGQKSMTRSDYDSYQAAFYSHKAETAKAQAQMAQAKASKSIAEANLVKARRNLEYCTIISPVDGVVIDRRVSVGQTVVSNQTASTIFLVARDFKKMQVWVSVNEADVGSIKVGMPVYFSCDAFPGVEFTGTVHRLRLNATLSSNVVTYIVEVNVDNKDGKLIPYLTANVKFVRAEVRNALAVPPGALRFTPPPEMCLSPAPELKRREAVIWVEQGEKKLRPIKVKVGLTNNLQTQIITDELKAGDKVVSGIAQKSTMISGGNNVRNPFMPNMPRRSGRGTAGQRERAAQRARGQ